MLLPLQTRRALGITNVEADGSGIQFRVNPGRMFERHCYVETEDDGSFTAGIAQRPRHDSDPVPDIRVDGLDPADLTGKPLIRALAGCADGAVADLPHWRDGLPADAEPVRSWELGERDVFHQAAAHTASLARQRRRPAFLHGDFDGFSCFAAPPGTTAFWSVTWLGEWSLHTGHHTRPLGRSPADPVGNRPSARIASLGRGVVTAPADFTARAARTPGPGRRRSPS
jgi:hypothetical protein